VSVLPAMQSPDHQHQPEPEDSAPPPTNSREEDENFREWVALVVLLACWLAEAYM
jgi:hypothetical protein